MSEKHYPYIGGSFDRIVFDGDGSVWVPEPENAKLREQVLQLQLDWEGERDYADQMEAKEKKAVAENIKLREMVEAVLQCTGVAKRDKGCDACPMYDKSKAISIKSEWCRLRPTLSELGIEVK